MSEGRYCERGHAAQGQPLGSSVASRSARDDGGDTNETSLDTGITP